jgi:hypothetical protein
VSYALLFVALGAAIYVSASECSQAGVSPTCSTSVFFHKSKERQGGRKAIASKPRFIEVDIQASTDDVANSLKLKLLIISPSRSLTATRTVHIAHSYDDIIRAKGAKPCYPFAVCGRPELPLFLRTVHFVLVVRLGFERH